MSSRLWKWAGVTAALCLATGAQAAAVVLDTGTIRMGVADNGGLGALGVGLVGPTGDAITPGCLCEGWGASANGASGYVYGLGQTGITSALTTTTTASGPGLSAQSVVAMSNGLQITHTYSYGHNGLLFNIGVELKNVSGATLNNVRYARTLDWDVTPGYFGSNFTTTYGGSPTGPAGQILHTSSNPFAVPDPMVFRGQEADVNIVNSPGDKGSYWVFGFGSLADGATANFTTVIGATPTVADLIAAFTASGVGAYSYTTGNSTAGGDFAPAYGYGFVGLSLPPIGTVPEPGTLALLGVAALGAMVRRRRAA